MKVVHVHVKMEVPDDESDVADSVKAALEYARPALFGSWKIKEVH